MTIEIPTEQRAGVVLASIVREATPEEIAEARRLHAEGRCAHTLVTDERGFYYDSRSCALCGKGLGLV